MSNAIGVTSRCLGVLLLVATAPRGLEAGNIFMKNGYIIQGPIVERSVNGIVLGWPHGKATIHHRFIESVTYEASEEKQLQELENQVNVDGAFDELPGGILGSVGGPEELPADADKLVRTYVIDMNAKKSQPVDGTGDTPGTEQSPVAGATGSETELTPVHRPDELLGERILDDSLGFAFRPPREWSLTRTDGGLQVAPAPVAETFRPSINVFRLPRGNLPGADYALLVREGNERILTQYELLSEGPRSVADKSAYEFLGRGTHANQSALVRQLLIEGPESLWLVTAFAPAQGGEAVAAAIEESLKTVELVGG